jgi:putative FmdB family regulatory protein
MPLYDWECSHCGHRYEAVARMADISSACPKCEEAGYRKFTPTRNFLIPASFRRSATWHMPEGERGSDSAPASSNNAVHTPKRKSFKEAFDEQWR